MAPEPLSICNSAWRLLTFSLYSCTSACSSSGRNPRRTGKRADNCLARKTVDSAATNFSANPKRVSGCSAEATGWSGRRGRATSPVVAEVGEAVAIRGPSWTGESTEWLRK